MEARRPRRRARRVLRELATIAGRVRAVDVRRRLRRAAHRARSRPRFADVPARRRQAHGRRPRRVAVPEAAARAAHRGRARPAQRRDLPRLHPRLPVLPGGDDHPARCASGPPSRCARWSREGLRRTGYDEVALTSLSSADFSGIDGVVADLVNDQAGTRQRVASRCRQPAGRRVHRRASRAEIQKVRRTGLTFAPEAGSWRHAPGDQQADHRGRPLRRGRRRVLAGLAAGEALLPHRPAHRDGRRHARHRRARQERRRRSASSTRSRRACTVSVGGFVPKPHTPFQWFGQNTRRRAAAQDRAAARRPAQGTRRAAEVARPRGDVRRGHREPRRPPHRRGHRAGVAGGRHVPGVERALLARPLARRDGAPRASTPTGTSPATAPTTRCCRGTTSRPGCTATSSGRTGRRRSPSTGSPIAGGRRATTAGCAPTTRSSTWWPRRSRPRAAARAPARTSRRVRACPCASSASADRPESAPS